MALASVFARLDDLEKQLKTVSLGTSSNTVDLSSSAIDLSMFENRLVKLEELVNKVSDLESKQLPLNLPDKVTELEALVSKLPEFNQRIQTLEANLSMIAEHIKSIDLIQLKKRVEVLENKD